MNRTELVGGVTAEPDLRALPSGTFVCEFTLAVREAFWSAKEREEKVRTHYIRCVAWAELGEFVGETFHRGDQVYVLGSLTQEVIEKDDKKDSKTKVRCTMVRLVAKRRSAGDGVEPPF
jgi:single-strand DNA-binding protein